MKNKKLINLKFIIVLLFGIFLILSFSFNVFAYTSSHPQYTQSGFGYSSGIFGSGSQPPFDSKMCGAGQDFVLQVSPTGCTPAIVRSDLLEEQDVWVFCPIAATKINPLIKIEAINYLTFKNEEFSKYVSDIGFHPVRSALGVQDKVTSPILENIGYAVVKLKKIPTEAEMPEFVEGNVTSRLVYDIENAFGTFRTGFYLKPMKDEEWNKEFLRYGFWRGKGYIKAEDVQSDGATISVYSGNTISRSQGTYQQKLATFSLKEGEESQQVYLPTFDYCLGGLKVKLEDIKDPDTTARLMINADNVEVVRGEKFLDNKCAVNKIEKIGLNQKVIISCEEDLDGGFLGFGKSKTFKLEVKPKIELKIDDKTGNYSIGEWLFDAGEKSVFLSYAYTKEDSPYEQKLKVVFTALPKEDIGSRKQLTEDELKSFKGFIERYREDEPDTGVGDFWTGSWNVATEIGYIFEMSSRWAISGESFGVLGYHDSSSLPGESGISDEQTKYVTVLGLASPSDSESMKDNSDYKNAMKDFDVLYSDFSSIKEFELKDISSYGQKAFEEKIKLARDTGQKKTMFELCEQFKEKYPGADVNEVCFNEFEFASSDISSADILIGNKVREISLRSIYEPTFDEYGANISIKFPDGKRKEIPLQKDNLVYLNTKIIGDLPEKLSESEASKIVSNEGIKWKDSVKFVGVRPQTLLEIIDLKEKCNCDLTITSVTDGTHASGLESHSTGYKIDLRSKDISSGDEKELYDYIKNNFEKIQDRTETDGTKSRQWKNKYGAIYTLEYEGTENEHWDVLVIGERDDLLSKFNGKANQFIQLKELETTAGKSSAVIRVNIPKDFWTDSFKFTDSIKLEEDVPEVVSTKDGLYEFTLEEVNLEKVAKVSIIPKINYAESESSFSFKIGIDKRDIKLAPEKTKEKIEKINKTIEDFEKASEVMGKTIQGLKGACLGVGGALHVKNLVENMQGKGIARQKVMRGDGGWYEICSDAVNSGKIDSREVNYKTQDECLIKESENIDKDVKSMTEVLARQQEDIKEIQNKYESETKFLEEKIINTESFAEEYSGQIKNNLESEIIDDVNKEKSSNNQIDLGEAKDILTKEGFNKNLYDIDELRNIDLSLRILNNPEASLRMKDSAKENLYSNLLNIQKNSKGFVLQDSWAKDLGIESSQISTFITKEAKKIPYTEITNNGKISELGSDVPIQPIQTSTGKQYLIVLDDSAGTGILSIKKDGDGLMIYDKSGKMRVSQTEAEDLKNIYFKKYDKSSYENPFKRSSEHETPVVKYYDTEAYKNLPSVVPFDLKNGWYAASRQNLPILGNIKSYDTSGRVNNFYLCNVGADGIEEFFSGIGDDICQQIFLESSKTYRNFPGLSESEAINLVESAVSAIDQASTARSRNPNLKIGDKIRINTRVGGSINLDVGRPAVEIPDIQCQDFMSPKECNIIFNLCDPVICPSSRCDFGGEYPVKDVIQSGVVGSTLLCLPNAKEKIYAPVCLTGIQAGVDGFISVEKAYKDCLQTSLDTGETVGICDEIQSVYMCDFFWRQAAPIGKIGISKVAAKVFGQGTRGGGEYLSVANAWESASKSAEYFTQSYGANSYQAFKSKSISKQLFAPVCEGFVSGVVPKVETFFDAVTEPDSPVQFHARFDEIPFSDVTVPPVSQYKVFYHIYAGKDQPVYYQVYLKPDSEGSFYQDAQMFRTVASGFIPIGEIATETKDFTAPAGYKTLCINVNGQEECGFKEVSTSFAVDYIKDQYAKEQITKTGVSSEKECASGTPSLYNFLTPNIQSSTEGAISPEIYKRGITRICATNNPGQGTDSSRWIEVGRCSDVGQNVKCWLDQQSTEDSIQFAGTKNKTIKELEQIWMEGLNLDENYEKDFNLEFEKIEKLGTTQEKLRDKISKTTALLGKTFFNKQKAKVILLKGQTYAELAKLAYRDWKDKQIVEELKEEESSEEVSEDISEILEIIPPFGKSEIRFTFVDEKSLSFQYFDNDWNVVIIEQPVSETPYPAPVLYNYISVENEEEILKFRKLTNIEKNVVESLKSKNYESGLKILVDQTSSCVNSCKLIVLETSSKMFNDRIFESKLDSSRSVYLFYENNQWEWYYGASDIKPKTFYGIPLVDSSMVPQDALDVIKSVEGKKFYEGAKIIFEYNAEKVAEEEISVFTETVEISQSITSSYEKYKNLFEKYSKKNLPRGFTENEFKSLLVAISQKETGVGTAGKICGKNRNENCGDWLMGYDNKYKDSSKGAEKQIALSSSLLKRAFEGGIVIYNNNCNLVSGGNNKNKINCILNSYRGYGQESNYANTVLQFKQDWEAYFEQAKSSEEEELSCKSCGNDENWYTFGLGNICDEEECKDLGRTLGKECVYSSVGGIPSCNEKS